MVFYRRLVNHSDIMTIYEDRISSTSRDGLFLQVANSETEIVSFPGLTADEYIEVVFRDASSMSNKRSLRSKLFNLHEERYMEWKYASRDVKSYSHAM